MKHKILLVVLLLFTLIKAYSQERKGFLNSSSSDIQCKEYFKENISLLDPIEGIYNVQRKSQSSNSFQAFPATTENITITIYKTSTGKYNIVGNNNNTIERIGETNAYSFLVFWEDINYTENKRFYLSDGMQFQVSYEIPQEKMKLDMGKKYQLGIHVEFTFDCIKQYPTYSMYQETPKIGTQEGPEKQKKESEIMDWTGSGFALYNDYIATNYHVVENATGIQVQGIKGDFNTKYNAVVFASDKNNDLAIIKIVDNRFNGFGGIPYSFKTNISEVGENVFVLGFPLTATMGDEIKLTTGVISSKTGFQGDVSLYQISAPIQSGNSGGPLFDEKGNLVGIVCAKHRGTENVGYAIKTSYLINLSESFNSEIRLPFKNIISTLPLTEKIKKLRNLVYLITCSNQNPISSNQNPISSNQDALAKRWFPENINVDDDIVINNPEVSKRPKSEGLSIKRVLVRNTQTVVEMEYDNSDGGWRYTYGWWINIDPNTHLIDKKTGSIYKLLRAEGIPLSPGKYTFSSRNEKLNFKLIFAGLPKDVTSFDLIESETSVWKFYGIKVK